VVYQDPADSKHKLADCNAGTAPPRAPNGIALHGSLANQPLTIHQEGPITIGAALTPGATYYLSATPGGICPYADLVAGCFPTIIGVALSASVLDVKIHQSLVSL
jgi:hypothetical protein